MKRPPGKLRIIGGQWRSRIVAFDAGPGVRPTPDRVRQTVFDWLTARVGGARCLDLFAGSGALGLEALSRGAAHVTFVDRGLAQCQAIRAALGKLDALARADVQQADALGFLAGRPATYDIVFVDPPFDAALLAPALAALPPALRPGAVVYAERHHEGDWGWPPGYVALRDKKAGQVSYALATYSPAERDSAHDDRRGV